MTTEDYKYTDDIKAKNVDKYSSNNTKGYKVGKDPIDVDDGDHFDENGNQVGLKDYAKAQARVGNRKFYQDRPDKSAYINYGEADKASREYNNKYVPKAKNNYQPKKGAFDLNKAFGLNEKETGGNKWEADEE